MLGNLIYGGEGGSGGGTGTNALSGLGKLGTGVGSTLSDWFGSSSTPDLTAVNTADAATPGVNYSTDQGSFGDILASYLAS